jgi:nucleotide-binding universal stress UspA family protein
MYNYILVPLDGSNRAEAILPHVEELGKRYDAQVIFLRVVEPMPISVGPGEASMLVPQEEIDRRTEQAIAYLDNLQE